MTTTATAPLVGPPYPDVPLQVGDIAPDFAARDQHGEVVRLSELLGTSRVIVIFFPFAFSGTCTGELGEVRDTLEDFQADDIAVVAISCDPMFSQRIFADIQGYFFPLVTDFWPHGAIARSYGVFNEINGTALRGTFLVEQDGSIRWTLVNVPGNRRDFSGYRAELAAIRAQGAAPTA